MRVSFSALLFLLVLGSASSAQAALRPFVRVEGTASRVKMEQVNDFWVAGWSSVGYRVKNFDGGLGYAGEFGLELGHGWSIGAGYHRLNLDRKSDPDEFERFVEYNITGVSSYGFLEYAFAPASNTDLILGGHVGILRLRGAGETYLLSTTSGVEGFDHEGRAPLYEAYVGADRWVGPQIAIYIMTGYRSARITKVTNEDGFQLHWGGGGPNLLLDYSGTFTRAGVTITLGR